MERARALVCLFVLGAPLVGRAALPGPPDRRSAGAAEPAEPPPEVESSLDAGGVLWRVGVVTYLVGAPTIHAARGERQDALKSLGLHVVTPIAGATAGLLVALAACPAGGGQFAGFCSVVSTLVIGLPVGVGGATILDAKLLGDGSPAAAPIVLADLASIGLIVTGVFWPREPEAPSRVALTPLALPGPHHASGLALQLRF